MKNYEAIIFDLDGTLLDTLEDLKDAVNYALRTLQMPEKTIDEIRSYVGNGIKLLVERSVPNGKNNPNFDKTFELFSEYYAVHSNDKTSVYNGMIPLLNEIKQQGYLTAIVSNKVDQAVQELVTLYFDGLIDIAIGERPNLKRKPAPDMIFKAIEELGISKDKTIFIGDSDVDVQTAQNAGIPCIAVLWGFRTKEILKTQGATLFASKPAEIKQFL